MKPKNKPVPMSVNCSVCGKPLVFSEGHDVSDCRHTIRFDLNGNATLPPNIVAPAHKEPTLEASVTKDERIVREAWEWVGTWVRDLDSYGTDQFNIAIFFSEKDAKRHDNPYQHWQEDNDAKGIASAWHSAAKFTVQRQEEIWQVEEEIKIVRNELSLGRDRWNSPEFIRILAREQATLAELQRGMKGTK
jgi:hypothetical protein